VKQSTNINLVIGKTTKSRKTSSKPRSEKQSSYQSSPNIITNISNPSAVPTNYQLPIYNQVAKPAPSPFLSNTPQYINVSEPLGKPNEKNEIPIVNKQVQIDPTPASGAVPAAFIPEEAPELIKTGGSIDYAQEAIYQKELNERARRRLDEMTSYKSNNPPEFYNNPPEPQEVEGEYLTEVQATPVRARKKYEYKPETVARRKAKKEQQQNVNPIEASVEPVSISPLEVDRNRSILEEVLSRNAQIAEASKQEQNTLLKEQKRKDTISRNKTRKIKEQIANSKK
jgi:hypothetical protein